MKTINKVFLILLFLNSIANINAQEKTTNKMETKKIAYADKILLHMHPEKFLNFLPTLNDDQIAQLYGMSIEEYHLAKKVYDDQAKNTASELLTNSDFTFKIDKLPFKKNQTILVIGESTADALNSWVYILQYLLDQRRPQDNIRIINAAISGQTTTEALRKITVQVKLSPDWVICHLGTNDCIRYGNQKTSVSLAETIANLITIKEIINKDTKANIVWLTPVSIDEKKAENFQPFKTQQLSLKNLDLNEISKYLKAQPEPVIDLTEEFGNPVNPEFVQYDGIHLTIDGQKEIVKSLINKLSNIK
jgi:acyl-CoA thioesterase-1